MSQLYKRFAVEQIRVLFQSYPQGTIDRAEMEAILQINKTRFFALLREYRRDPEKLSITYERQTPPRLSAEVEAAISRGLLREKELVENPEFPISSRSKPDFSGFVRRAPQGRSPL